MKLVAWRTEKLYLIKSYEYFLLLECVVHTCGTQKIQKRQEKELLLDELLRHQEAKCGKDEDPPSNCRRIETPRTTPFRVSYRGAHVIHTQRSRNHTKDLYPTCCDGSHVEEQAEGGFWCEQ